MSEAISRLVADDCSLAAGLGLEALSPFAAGHEIMRQRRRGLLFQFPLDSISELAKALLRMGTHLEPTLEYGGRQFTIPTDCKMGKNWGSMVELKFSDNEEELLQNLKDTIAKLGE